MPHLTHAHTVLATLECRRPVQSPDIDDVVRDSWLRSVSEHGLEPDRVVEPDVLSHAELLQHRAPLEELSALAIPEIERLYGQLIDHADVVTLFDSHGVLVDFRSSDSVLDVCSSMRVIPGAIWSEEKQGTTGAGVCLRERRPLSVVMGEHFATKLASLSCTVAPIFGLEGRLAGVLNVTSTRATSHAMQSVVRQVVASSARRIENRYFDRRHERLRVIRLSRHDDFCDVGAEARLALDDQGRIVDATPLAQRLLGVATGAADAPGLIGRKLGQVADVGSLERLLQDPEASIRGVSGRVHLRLSEPARRSVSKGMRSRVVTDGARAPSGEENRTAADRVADDPTLAEIAGTDAAMLDRLRVAQRLHARRLPLLLRGESGSGKTMLARALHRAGPHRQGGFVAINCAAIPKELIESELFGYRPGAFTGAAKDGSPGRLVGAHRGTLFLDEIGDMPLALQGRLLQVLSEGEFVPIGATEPVKVQFALLSASLRDVSQLVRDGLFREDLFYRISGATLVLPPLRERTDLNELVDEAFRRGADEAGTVCPFLSDAARHALTRHAWPGNHRELQHVARFAVALCESGVISLGDLPAPLGQASCLFAAKDTDRLATPPRADLDRHTLSNVLTRTGWNVSVAASELGVSRATLHRRLKEFDLRRPGPPRKR